MAVPVVVFYMINMSFSAFQLNKQLIVKLCLYFLSDKHFQVTTAAVPNKNSTSCYEFVLLFGRLCLFFLLSAVLSVQCYLACGLCCDKGSFILLFSL